MFKLNQPIIKNKVLTWSRDLTQTELIAWMKASRPSVSKALHGEIDLASAVRFANQKMV